MKAEDIDLRQMLVFSPEQGELLLNGRRMIMHSMASFAVLQKLVVEHLGHAFSDALSMQFGYRCGVEDYFAIAEGGQWESDAERLLSGPVTHMWEGLVHVEPTLVEYDRATRAFRMCAVWRNSYEAANYLENFGRSDRPVCMSLTGYASGWASTFFGDRLLAIETQCLAAGDPHCAVEIRPESEWGPEAEIWRTALRATTESVSSALEQKVSERTQELQSVAAELAAARDVAESASRAKTQFITNISHELRTPMNGVIGFAQLLKDTELDGRQRELVDLIIESGTQQVSIIGDLLDFGQLDSGQVEVQKRPFDPDALLAKVMVPFESQARQKDVSFSVLTTGLPEMLISDPLKVSQIIGNVVGNAVKFTHPGGWVRVTAMVSGGELVVEVQDSGEGLTQELLDRLLQPLSETAVSAPQEGGMGLAIARELADLLEGELTGTSTPGTGATFRIRLPVGVPAPAAPVADSRSKGDEVAVLVAEDNRINAIVVTKMLESLDCAVTLAENGAQAVEAFRDSEFSLIVLDLHMPELDGFSAMQQMRALEQQRQRPALPIVALTADAYTETRERCLSGGFTDFLAKPVRLEELSRIVRAVRSDGG